MTAIQHRYPLALFIILSKMFQSYDSQLYTWKSSILNSDNLNEIQFSAFLVMALQPVISKNFQKINFEKKKKKKFLPCLVKFTLSGRVISSVLKIMMCNALIHRATILLFINPRTNLSYTYLLYQTVNCLSKQE